MTEKHINVAYKLLKTRNACRTFYASGWEAKQKEWEPIIRAAMTKHDCDELEAAIILGKQLEGFSLMACLGTVMEMMEPKA